MALARALAVEPEVLLLDEPFGALDARVRKELRDWLRRLHDEVHVTTVFVTHDQEEAMQIADEIVLVNKGRIEQIGAPRDLYERPANEFVLTFVGEATRLGDALVRPHDLALSIEPEDGAVEALVERVVAPRLRGARRARARRRQRLSRSSRRDEAERARARAGPDRLRSRARTSAVAAQWRSPGARVDCVERGDRARAGAPAATSASVTSSSTARMFARSAINTSRRRSPRPRTRAPPAGRRARSRAAPRPRGSRRRA